MSTSETSDYLADFSSNILTESNEKPTIVQRSTANTVVIETNKVFTTHRKTTHRKQKSKNSIVNSRLLSIEKELGISGLLDGKVYHLSFDCPKPLAKLFKEATKANHYSICEVLQDAASAYVLKYVLEKSTFRNTLTNLLNRRGSSTTVIENINHVQYTQTKPRRLIRDSEDSVEVENIADVEVQKGICVFPNCTSLAVGKAIWLKDNKECSFCREHLDLVSSQRRLYRIVEVKEGS